jgi:hypothetical protein
MQAAFGMDGDRIGAGRDEGLEKRIDWRHHQVNVEELLRRLADGCNDRCAEGEIGHEMAVHDIDVDPVGARLVDGANFFPEPCKIRRQDRSADENRASAAESHQMTLAMAAAVSVMRFEKPHSLSYQLMTRTSVLSMTLV